MATNYLILDIATAGIPDAGQYFDPVTAPANYKDPEKIAAYVKEKEAEQVERAGLDMDLCCITGIGYRIDGAEPVVRLCKDEDEERRCVADFGTMISDGKTLISFNGLRFDWPVLMRRSRYLDIHFPTINLDRYKSNHIDLFAKLTNNGVLPGKSLRFYASRLGWLDLEKTLSGAEEAQIFQHQKWAELESSIRHDVTATYRLAQWMGAI